MIALVLALFASTAQAACPDPTPASELTANVDDALLSFATLDEEGFIESSDALQGDILCLSEILSQPDAASIHRAFAMRSFWDGDDSGATAHFRAARRLEPSHTLSDKIAPEGGPLATLYAGATAAPRMDSVRAPSWTTVYVDGERASRRPADIPSLVQYEVGGDGVVWSSMTMPGDQLPSLDDAKAARGLPAGTSSGAMERPVADAGGTGSTERTPAPETIREDIVEDLDAGGAVARDSARERDRAADRSRGNDGGGSPKGALLGATVATGVVAAGLFGVSAYSRSQFDDNPTEDRYKLTNATFFGSVGAAAVTAGLLGATIAVK